MNKINQFALYLIIAVIGGAFSYFVITKIFNHNVSNDISNLVLKNEEIVKKNKSLDSLNNLYLLEISNRDVYIGKLKFQDDSLKSQFIILNNKIKSLKQDYEKANHHADNFGSNDIKRYFSDSLPR